MQGFKVFGRDGGRKGEMVRHGGEWGRHGLRLRLRREGGGGADGEGRKGGTGTGIVMAQVGMMI